ncbi:MAG: sigma-70 family RNA polymerase sigma factor [Clostridia bacterium]|nr:sigma-70 family RNA polymerase sigma factor [Clostridia bacterium]
MVYEYERMVRTIARGLMRSYDVVGLDEEDLVQEGMIALLKAQQTYNEKSNAKFETYASVVIRNRIIDVIRSYKVIEPIKATEPTVGEDFDSSGNHVEELLKILHEVLQKCSDVEKAIFNAYFQGYSYDEICKIFSINKKKVDNTIQKIHRLAQEIRKD